MLLQDSIPPRKLTLVQGVCRVLFISHVDSLTATAINTELIHRHQSPWYYDSIVIPTPPPSTFSPWQQLTWWEGGWLEHLRVFSSIPGLHPLETSSTPCVWQPKCLQASSNVPWGVQLPTCQPMISKLLGRRGDVGRHCFKCNTTTLDFRTAFPSYR